MYIIYIRPDTLSKQNECQEEAGFKERLLFLVFFSENLSQTPGVVMLITLGLF